MGQNLLDKMNNDKNSKIIYLDLKKELENELAKPIELQDLDLIDEINKCIIEMTQLEFYQQTFTENDINNKIALIRRKQRFNHNKSQLKKFKLNKTLVASITIVLVASSSYLLLNNNIKEMMFSYGDTSSIHETNTKEIVLPITQNDPYGLKTVCQNNGMEEEILTPDYIPSKFKLISITNTDDIQQTEGDSNLENVPVESMTDGSGFSKFFNIYNTNTISEECSNFTQFVYENDEQVMNISIEQYISEMSACLSVAEDNENIEKLDIKGRETLIYKNNQDGYNVEFCNGDMVYRLQTQNIEYNTILKIAESFV